MGDNRTSGRRKTSGEYYREKKSQEKNGSPSVKYEAGMGIGGMMAACQGFSGKRRQQKEEDTPEQNSYRRAGN
ncbi:MAG: hypothetical protein KKC19_00300 [Nanoarchaeota archaeon]|nr:hypothetical protein [Nanoarchaeota archaeon]